MAPIKLGEYGEIDLVDGKVVMTIELPHAIELLEGKVDNDFAKGALEFVKKALEGLSTEEAK